MAFFRSLFSKLFGGRSRAAPAPATKKTAKVAIAAAPPTGKAKAKAGAASPELAAESLCGIDPQTMDREAIRQQLAALYRRHNAAAASLDAELRAEAEQMLDAIVVCRERYVDPS